jgi:hypothetical protein
MPESGVRNRRTLIVVAVRLVGPLMCGGFTAFGSGGVVVVVGVPGNVVVVVVGSGSVPSRVDADRLASGE